MKTVVVIGAGFTGTLTSLRLLAGGARVILINRGHAMARGVAYGTRALEHVLNVPAGRMSAFDEDPGSFLRYVQAIDPSYDASSFVPRRLYGDYLQSLLDSARRRYPDRFQTRLDAVTRIEVDEQRARARLALASGALLSADRVVLALGNFSPADPPVPASARQFFVSPRYIRDPWQDGVLESVDPDRPVLLIGTGLTMLDVALALVGRGQRAPMHAISRRGLLPLAHRDARNEPPPIQLPASFLATPPTARSWLRALRQLLASEQALGKDWRDVIGGLRSATPAIWQQLPSNERRRFLRHLRALWDVHRHRCAPQLAAALSGLIGNGLLQVAAGRIREFDEQADGSVRVHWRRRGRAQSEPLEVAAVINCTGPEGDTRVMTEPLIEQLRRDGLLCPDELGLGLQVDARYALIDRQGAASRVLHYVGPFLKAQDWEATAVPELRKHATRLAATLAPEASAAVSG